MFQFPISEVLLLTEIFKMRLWLYKEYWKDISHSYTCYSAISVNFV